MYILSKTASKSRFVRGSLLIRTPVPPRGMPQSVDDDIDIRYVREDTAVLLVTPMMARTVEPSLPGGCPAGPPPTQSARNPGGAPALRRDSRENTVGLLSIDVCRDQI